MSAFLQRLKRRRLVQWTIAYVAGAWVALQVAEVLAGVYGWPASMLRGLTVVLAAGLFVTLVLAWYHGERGQQHLSALEGGLLALIAVVTGTVLLVVDFGGPPDAPLVDEDHFAGQSTRRLTADRFHDSEPDWSPDGEHFVYVSDRSGSADLWLRGADGTELQLTDNAAEDTQPAWSPDGRLIAFVSSRDHGAELDESVFFGYSLGGGIWIVTAFGGEPTLLIDGAFNPDWSPEGDALVFDASFGGPRRIWVSLADGTQRRAVSSDESDLTAHMRPAWSPDGRWIVYERQEGSQSAVSNLQLVDVNSGETRWLTRGVVRDLAPAWVDPERLVFASDRGGAINLWQISIDAQTGKPQAEPVRVTRGAGDDTDPAVARDGRLLYTTLRRVQNLRRVPVDPVAWSTTGEATPVLDAAWNDIAPVTSPDGKELVFVSDRDGDADLWRLDRTTGEITQMTEGPGQDLQPHWSQDGRQVVFFSDRDGNNDIWVVSARGGPVVQLTDDPADDVNPYWSPDGTRIAFMSDRDGGRSEVWVMNADGGQPGRLTDVGATGHTARWSPDGKWILFTSMADGDRDIWAVAEDGSELRQLTHAETQDAHGLWSPDGRWFLYLAGHATLYVQSFGSDDARVLYEPGERIDYTYLTPDGSELLFTMERVEGDLWLLE